MARERIGKVCVLSASGLLLAMMLMVSRIYAVEAKPTIDGEIWRVPDRDGLHSLYLQLRLLGKNIAYADFVARSQELKDQEQGFVLLVHLARHFGVELVTVQTTLTELAEARFPAVVYLEVPDRKDLCFSLFVHSGRMVSVVDGPTVELKEYNKDEFLRAWTGHALMPKMHASVDVRVLMRLVSVAVWICVIVLAVVRRSSKHSADLRHPVPDPRQTETEECI